MTDSKRVGGSRAPPPKKQSKPIMTTKKSKNKESSTTSKLLELPAEVRDKIFRYVLVSNEPTEVQFTSVWWRTSRRRFTMIPGLINVSKQLRSETQRIFFEENTFVITPEVWKLKQRSATHLLLFRTMHHNLGLELRSVSVCQEIKMRVQKVLFQLKAKFTITTSEDGSLLITKQDYSGTYIGRSLSVAPHLDVCGCDIATHARLYNHFFRGSGILRFLQELRNRNALLYDVYRSYHLRDLLRKDEVVCLGGYCQECRTRGRRMVAF